MGITTGVTNHCGDHWNPQWMLPPTSTYPFVSTTWTPTPAPTPHTCPVCKGRCEKEARFYGLPGQHFVACRSCQGKGLVWEGA